MILPTRFCGLDNTYNMMMMKMPIMMMIIIIAVTHSIFKLGPPDNDNDDDYNELSTLGPDSSIGASVLQQCFCYLTLSRPTYC